MFQQVLQMQVQLHTSSDKTLPWKSSELVLRKGKVKKCRTNPGNLLWTWTEIKGLPIYLVKKFLAAYRIVLPPINKAINMEGKKKKRRCITFITPFRSLMCNQCSICAPQVVIVSLATSTRKAWELQKTQSKAADHTFCDIPRKQRTSPALSHSPLVARSPLRKDWVCR